MSYYYDNWPDPVCESSKSTTKKEGGGGGGGEARERRLSHGIVQVLKTALVQLQTRKGSKESWFILTQTHSMQIFWEIPFVKLQNDT